MRVIAALLALVAAQTCLPDGLQEHERRNLTYPGYNGPIVDSNPWWASAQVIHGLAKILFTEVVGYTYVNKYSVPSSVMFVLGPSGCKEMFALNDCEEYDEWAPQIHYGLEGWGSGLTAYSRVPPERRAIMLTKHAYRGVESIFIRGDTEHSAYEEDHYILGTYQGWNVTAFPNLKNHFNGGLGNTLPLLEAAGVPMQTLASTPSANMHENYVGATGDNGLACYDSATRTLTADPAETCQGDWWVTPTCRADPDSCIPIVTSSGWGEAEFRQWGAFYDMPLAITDTSWGGYVSAVSTVNVGFYWWYPDATFATVDPKKLEIPSWNINEHAEGIFRTSMPEVDLTRFVWHHMEVADFGRGKHIVSVLNRMSIYKSDIDEFMIDFGQGMTGEEIACEWLKVSEDRWLDWIPNLNECIAGDGWTGSECVTCEPGTVSIMDTEANNRLCKPTQPGEYSAAPGSTQATLCEPGYMCPNASMPMAIPCKIGTDQREEGRTTCSLCEPGHYAQFPGTAECAPCPMGHFGESAGLKHCSRCMVRDYQDETGQTECKQCKPGFISPPGASMLMDCVCAQDTFFSVAQDKCLECQYGAVCLQGSDVPLVEASFYAEEKMHAPTGEYKRSDDGAWSYHTAELGETQVFDSLTVWNCPFGSRACPGRDIENSGGYLAESARMVNECAGDLFLNGCTRCVDGYFYNADTVSCEMCTGGDNALYPMIYVLGLLALLSVYKITRYSATQKLTNMLMFSCSASLLVNFFQMLGVIGFYAVEFPSFLNGFFDFFRLFVFDLDVLRASCATGADFKARFLTRNISPVIFIGSFVALYPLSVVVSKATAGKLQPLDKLNIFNTCGLVTNAGYIALCKISLQFYECKHHPSAPSTVAAYPYVNCNSDEHHSMIGLAVICTLVYSAGIYFLCLYLCWVAPAYMIESQEFRRKTRFLVGRWNPSRWYWGPVLQTRNLCVALVAVLYPSDGIMQLVVTGAIVVIYTSAQAVAEPWRDNFLNMTDSVLGLAITLTCMFGVMLVHEVGDLDARSTNATAYLTAIFAVSFMALFYAIFRALAAFVNPSKALRADRVYTMQATKVLLLQTKRLYELCRDGIQENEIAEAVSCYMTFSEQRAIFKLGKVLLHEMCGINFAGGIPFKRLMINRVEEKPVDLAGVDVNILGELDKEELVAKAGRVSVMSRMGGSAR